MRLDLDPDVVAAMDEDFDYSDPDNILEDNFVELANATLSEYVKLRIYNFLFIVFHFLIPILVFSAIVVFNLYVP